MGKVSTALRCDDVNAELRRMTVNPLIVDEFLY
jgi:hypothetical protein